MRRVDLVEYSNPSYYRIGEYSQGRTDVRDVENANVFSLCGDSIRVLIKYVLFSTAYELV